VTFSNLTPKGTNQLTHQRKEKRTIIKTKGHTLAIDQKQQGTRGK